MSAVREPQQQKSNGSGAIQLEAMQGTTIAPKDGSSFFHFGGGSICVVRWLVDAIFNYIRIRPGKDGNPKRLGSQWPRFPLRERRYRNAKLTLFRAPLKAVR